MGVRRVVAHGHRVVALRHAEVDAFDLEALVERVADHQTPRRGEIVVEVPRRKHDVRGLTVPVGKRPSEAKSKLCVGCGESRATPTRRTSGGAAE